MWLILLDPGIRRDDENGVNQSFPKEPLFFYQISLAFALLSIRGMPWHLIFTPTFNASNSVELGAGFRVSDTPGYFRVRIQ